MVVTLNHALVPSRDGKASAQFVSEILDCPIKVQGPFHQVQIANGLTLDFERSNSEPDDGELVER